jgi:hypothetical protein
VAAIDCSAYGSDAMASRHGPAPGLCDDSRVTRPSKPFIGESRWPPAAALVLFMAVTIALRVWLPHEGFARLPWLVPTLEAILLVVLLVGAPGHLARRTAWVRRVVLALVFLFVAGALWSTTILVYDLVQGTGVANEPTELLATGAVVWLGNTLAFAMLFWLLDGGGPVARSFDPKPVDFAFPQHLSPEVSPAGWRPLFLDYLYVGFTNSTAFSPTDAMPLTHRAKFAMVVQASVSVALFALILARAVNAFT